MLTAGRFVIGQGGEGGAECLEVLKSLDAVGVDLVSKVKTGFDEEGRLTDEAARERLRAFLWGFVEYARTKACAPAE